ncbi:MAG: tRNA uridine-5-carboxymethylaminomethyl(34) synthesis GTPase MnmE [Gammaproteobacteria bacterium]|nr:tRNA uridine-5-carboxymethylaminomethyl(34) synthesis GTPase MnmE [Gammaproteobacteria bacterium]
MKATADTIVAPATPPGIGGVGVVRISGPRAEHIARCMLGSLPEPRRATYARFRGADGGAIDAGIALYFPPPTSFTGEAVLELQGHGGPVVMALLVEAAVALGARLAEPGEFTRRAFLNDKLDLAQAEAVADLIGSSTAQAARAALRSLSGVFSRELDELAERLVRLRMHVEAAIDFPEEEVDFLADDALLAGLDACADAFREIMAKANSGRVLKNGYRVVIVGKPNVGKSSLLNRLSGEDAAIVTEVAGTTRDILREQVNIDGLAVELIDTAGLRDDPDRIEQEGIRRARKALASADAVLWIQDATAAGDCRPDEGLPEGIPLTVVQNKIDLSGELPGYEPGEPGVVRLSARTGAGIDALRLRLREMAGYEDFGEGAFTARQRHVDALQRAAQHFAAGRRALRHDRAGELLAEELRLAQQVLGEITGPMSADELLGRIFADFCIGK